MTKINRKSIVALTKQEKGSIAVYVIVSMISFCLILSIVYFSTIAIRKEQIRTEVKIKEVYEKTNYQQEIEDTYVKENLIAYFDGTNNTGEGHSSTTTLWKDLSGNNNDGLLSRSLDNNKFYWGENCIILSNNSTNGATYIETPINLNNKERTIYFTIDASNLLGSIWGDTNSKNENGLFCYYNFIANRKAPISIQNRINYEFSKNGIYNYVITLSKNEMKFYKNGNLINETDNTIGLTTSNNLRLLSNYNSNQNATNLKMYNFMVYDRALTEEEIKKNYNIVNEKLIK